MKPSARESGRLGLTELFPELRRKLDQTPLRLLTCGSVDDGKSTLIGRLLVETKQVPDDQMAALHRDTKRYLAGKEGLDYSLLLDGLDIERQQGITIDVSYRYFSTDRRAFIVADCPGHEQYTRNMVTAASNSDVAVLLVDAQKGLLTQTRRHALICSLLGIRRVVLAVNKCDLIDYGHDHFDAIRLEFEQFAKPLNFVEIVAIPTSARVGDNIIAPLGNTPWYGGPSLIGYLENVNADSSARSQPFRLSVQWIVRGSNNFRGICGTIASGRVQVDDSVVVLPSNIPSRVSRILQNGRDQSEAEAGAAVCLALAHDVDVARGDMLAHPEMPPATATQFAAHLICVADQSLVSGRNYLMRIGNKYLPASITSIKHLVDIDTGLKVAARRVVVNDIAVGTISTTQPISHDPYMQNRETGSFILIDRFNNQTVAAGMIDFDLYRAHSIHPQQFTVDRRVRAQLKRQRPVAVWFTGLSGAGKSTIANALEVQLHSAGYHTYALDGDNLRMGLNRDLGFTEADRVENVRRAGEVAKLLVDAGLIVLCSFISPFRTEREMVRDMFEPGAFLEVFVDTPIETCIRRDPKKLYAKAFRGEIKNFTGVDSRYEIPEHPDLRLLTQTTTADELAAEILEFLRTRKYIV